MQSENLFKNISDRKHEMEESVIAVHQPNFLPWTGFFHKIVHCDNFIILDDAQFPKKGGNWINRNQLMNNGKPIWCTLSVKRNFSGTKEIREIELENPSSWQEIYLRRVRNLYRGSDFYSNGMEFLERIFHNIQSNKIAEVNVSLIKAILQELELKFEHIQCSSNFAISSKETDRLIDLLKITNSKIYLSGRGSKDYLDENLFYKNNFFLVYQNFYDFPYFQLNSVEYLPRLSIIDSILNIGINETRKRII
jgi:hypothetical protein